MNSKTGKILNGLNALDIDLSVLKSEMNNELKNLLHFWSSEALDLEHGGFIGRIDYIGKKHKNATKGSVLNTRILWTFSAAFRITKNKKYKVIADKVYKYITEHFWDDRNGGLFWEIDYLGKPLNKRKQAYAQGFGIYAFSEYYRATQNVESLNFAKSLYYILEDKFWDPRHSGYIEALNHDWTHIEDMRLSHKDLNTPKSMNTHLHILEPYTNLYRVWQNDKLKKSIISLLDIFQTKIIDRNSGHFNLFFEMDWKAKSTTISFGHDIEGAWLLHEAAQEIDEKELVESIQKSALKLVNITLNQGLDIDGSVFNEFDIRGYDKDKNWWPQAEAMVGLMDAYEIEPKQEYLSSIFKIWEFIKNNLIDTVNGEWFWRVDVDGKVISTDDKIGFWKCPYHNSRALMEVISRIEKIKN